MESLAAYRSLEDMTRELGLRESPAMVSLPSGAVTAILGREFLVPNDDRSDDVLLNHAIEIAQDKDFRQKRTNFQRWQREFVRDGVTDEASVKKAVEEMRDLIADEQRAVRSKQISVGIQFSLMVGSLVCGVLAAPLAPIAIAGAFMSIGQFAADKWMPAGEDGTVSAGAAFYSAQKRLGWR